MTQFRFAYIIFAVKVVLVYTVGIRTTSSRIFHRLEVVNLKQTRLNQTLRQKQLQIESIINPAAISERLERLGKSQ